MTLAAVESGHVVDGSFEHLTIGLSIGKMEERSPKEEIVDQAKRESEWAKARQRIVAMHNKGKSVRQISIATDKSTQWVYAVLKEAGIQFKQRGVR